MENKVLAVVKGKEITQFDLESTIARFPMDKQGYFRSEQGKKQLLDQIISFELIYNDAMDNALENEKEFKQQLEQTKKDLLTQFAINKVFSKITIDDKDVQEYYDKNQDKFLEPESVTASHILVNSEEKATEVANEIKNGVTFEEAASLYSECPSKNQGGRLGSFTRGKMVKEFEEAAFNAEIGIVTEPVKTQFGYHLIKVEEKNPQKVIEIEEVAAEIKNELAIQKQNQAYMNYVDDLSKKYSVEYK